MATVIAFANQKGGVGKTTLSTQFAFYLATICQKKVLFIDMDAQGNASETMLQRGPVTGTRSEDLFDILPNGADNETLKPKVQTNSYGIDVIGSDGSAKAYDVDSLPLEQILNPKERVDTIAPNYDYIVIDCPPNLSRRLTGALIFTDFVICPVMLQGYVVSSITHLFETIKEVKDNLNINLKILGIAVNDWRPDASQRKALAEVDEALPGYIFETKVRKRSPLYVAGEGQPIHEVEFGKPATKELTALFEEMMYRMEHNF